MSTFINPNDYEEGSPENILASFYLSWQRRDFDDMLNHCQPYWIEREKNPIGHLEAKFGDIELKKVLYIKEADPETTHGLRPELVRDFLALVEIKAGGKVSKKKLIPRLIKENPCDCKPSIKGSWGVNPLSAVRTIKKEKVK